MTSSNQEPKINRPTHDIFDNLSSQSDTDNTLISLTTQTVTGEIRKIIYSSQDSGYTVIKLVDKFGIEHILTGYLIGAAEGQTIRAEGKWETHREYGKQFKVSSYEFTLPVNREGIIRYLSSDIFKGLGKKTAEMIVDYFPDNTIEILTKNPSRLIEVPGFGKKRLQRFLKDWEENRERRELMLYLQSLGITPAYCTKILKKYGDNAADIIKENPYRLAYDIEGIGFIVADNIAKNMGISENDPIRLQAAAFYIMKTLITEGHVCYPEEEFTKLVTETFKISEQNALAGLEKCLEEEQFISDPCSFVKDKQILSRMLYEKKMYNFEVYLAKYITSLANIPYHAAKNFPSKFIPSVNLNKEQIEAIANVKKYSFSVITGGPGVGKTTIIGEIVKLCSMVDLKVMLAAPTGRAAKRLQESTKKSAQTIHRLLKWDPKQGRFYYGTDKKLPCDVLIVDEVSMLDMFLACFLFRAVNHGTTVVMVGDADQLPSVGPGNVLHDIINSKVCPVTHLKEIYRQAAGSNIIVNAHKVNSGKMPDIQSKNKHEQSDFYWIEEDDHEKVLSTIVKMVKERIPARFGYHPIKDIQILTPMNKGTCGTVALNELLQAELNSGFKPQFSTGERIFKVNDPVMQIKNNYDKRVFNGDIGRIVKIDSKQKCFTVKFDDAFVDYAFHDADQITLSYAVTIHKSQGCEFPVVIVPLLTQHFVMLRRNLLYTAMTRAKKLLILIGSKKALSICVSNYKTEPRHTMLEYRIKVLNENP